jgi:MFS family permease
MTQAWELPKWRLVLALAALFLSSMCTMGDLVISPIAANVYEAFADAPIALVNLGVTGPALVGLPFGLLTGLLCDRIDKKKAMVVGFGIFTVSSVFGIAYVDVNYFVVMRLLATGVGWGITNTAALSILADLFVDENEHAKFVGWYNAAMSTIGALLSSCAGLLAVDGWTNAYHTYLIAVPVLVMLMVFLPSFPAKKSLKSTSEAVTGVAAVQPSAAESPTPQLSLAQQVEEVHGMSASSAAAMSRAMFNSDNGSGEALKCWWKRLALLSVQVFLIATLYFVLLYMVGLYIADVNVGNEAFTGFATSVMTVATAVGSLGFGAAYKRLQGKIYLPALAAIGIVFFVMAYFPTASVIICCLAVAGFAWPLYFCYFYTHCTKIVPQERQSTSTSIVAAADGLAVSACSFLLTGSMAATGCSCAGVYPLFGAATLAITAVSAIVMLLQSARCKAVAKEPKAVARKTTGGANSRA